MRVDGKRKSKRNRGRKKRKINMEMLCVTKRNNH